MTRVLAVLVDTLDELVVAVAGTRSWSRCPHCGFDALGAERPPTLAS